jgi:hypothetical protein
MKKGKTKITKPKEKKISFFDHVKHITQVQDPNYYNNLSEFDQKSFNHFMILKALSMNPYLIDDVATLYRYFDVIPPAQFYQLLIAIIPIDKGFYKWIKGQKKNKFDDRVIDYVAEKFQVSTREAIDYANILPTKELWNIVRGFGLTEKETDTLMKGTDENE